jgi:hypothetical protein
MMVTPRTIAASTWTRASHQPQPDHIADLTEKTGTHIRTAGVEIAWDRLLAKRQ